MGSVNPQLLSFQTNLENRSKSRNGRQSSHLFKQRDPAYFTPTLNIDLGKLKPDFLRELVDGMVEDGRAEWIGKGPRVQALLYWLKPEEWANMISNWVFCFKVRLI